MQMQSVPGAKSAASGAGEIAQSGGVRPVSVVVPIYNGQDHVQELADCLVKQSFPQDDCEYLLVDNDSTDSTVSLLKGICQNYKERNFRWLSETSLRSSYAARNEGIRNSEGAIIAFTDADCRPQSNWLEELVRPFEDPSVGVVVGATIAFNPTNWVEKYAVMNEVLSHKRTLAHRFLPFGGTLNLAVRRELFGTVGLFRQKLETGGDADFCWRAQLSGKWKMVVAESAVVAHCHRKTVIGIREQIWRYGRARKYKNELYRSERDPVFELACRFPGRAATWLFAELPRAVSDALSGRDPRANLFALPMDVLLGIEYLRGYFSGRLSPGASNIEYLTALDTAASKDRS